MYERTHAGLASLVPSRAARRILDAGLLSERRSAHAISAEEMASVLMGPVMRDLQAVLPPAGVRRELERLARSLRGRPRRRGPPPTPPGAGPPIDEPMAEPIAAPVAEPTAAGTIRTTTEPTAEPTADRAAGAPLDPPSVPALPAPDVGLIAMRDVATPVPPSSRRRMLPDDHELVLGALAPLDGVAGVGVFDALGSTVVVRGDLPDPEALGPVIAVGGDLLGRHGELRTVCVATEAGVLVAVPVPPRWITVTGRSDVNLGAVYAALAALEEER